MASIGSLVVHVQAETTQFRKEMRDLRNMVRTSANNIDSALISMGKSAAAVAQRMGQSFLSSMGRLDNALRLENMQAAFDRLKERAVASLRSILDAGMDLAARMAAPFQKLGERISGSFQRMGSRVMAIMVRLDNALRLENLKKTVMRFVMDTPAAFRRMVQRSAQALSSIRGSAQRSFQFVATNARRYTGLAWQSIRGFTTRTKNALQRMWKDSVRWVRESTARTARLIRWMGRRIRGTMRMIRNTIRSALSPLGIVLGAAGIGFGLTKLISGFLNLAGSVEKAEVLLTRLYGSAAMGRQAFSWLLNFSAKAPVSLAAVQNAFVRLKVAGIEPMEGAMQALVDAVAAFGGTDQELRRAGLAIQQMAGKGVISMEELRQQLGEAVPSSLQVLAEELDISLFRLVRKIQRAELSAAEGLPALFRGFNKRFQGAADALANTWRGLWKQILTIWQKFQIEVAKTGVFRALTEGLRGVLERLRDMEKEGTLKKWAQETGIAILEGFNRALQGIRGFMMGLREVGKFFLRIQIFFLEMSRSIKEFRRDILELVNVFKDNKFTRFFGAKPDTSGIDALNTDIDALNMSLAELKEKSDSTDISDSPFISGISTIISELEAIIRKATELEGISDAAKRAEDTLNATKKAVVETSQVIGNAMDKMREKIQKLRMADEDLFLSKIVEESRTLLRNAAALAAAERFEEARQLRADAAAVVSEARELWFAFRRATKAARDLEEEAKDVQSILDLDPWRTFKKGTQDAIRLFEKFREVAGRSMDFVLDFPTITTDQVVMALEKVVDALPVLGVEADRTAEAMRQFDEAIEMIRGAAAKGSIGLTKSSDLIAKAYAKIFNTPGLGELRRMADDMAEAFEGVLEAEERGKRGELLSGMIQGVKDYRETAEDVFGSVRDVTVRAFQDMEDALVKFVQTGKLSFRDFVNTVVEGLIRIAVQKAIVFATGAASAGSGSLIGLIGTLFGAKDATGGLPPATGPAAEGGLVTRPTLALIGEAGPEAVVPLPKLDRIIQGATFAEVGIRPLAEGGIVTEPTLALIGEAGPEAVIPLERSEFVKRWMSGDIGPDLLGGLGMLEPGGRDQERMATETARSEARSMAMMIERAESGAGGGADIATVVSAVESRAQAFESQVETRRFQVVVDALEGEAGRIIREVLEQSSGVVGGIRQEARTEFATVDRAGRDLGQFASRTAAVSPVTIQRVGEHVSEVALLTEASGMDTREVMAGIQEQTGTVVGRIRMSVEELASGVVQGRIQDLEERLPEREFGRVLEQVRGYTGPLSEWVQEEFQSLTGVSGEVEDRARTMRDMVTRIRGETSVLGTLTDRAGIVASRVGAGPDLPMAATDLRDRTTDTVQLVDRVHTESIDVLGRFRDRVEALVRWVGSSSEDVVETGGGGRSVLREVLYQADEIRDRSARLSDWSESQVGGVAVLADRLTMTADIGELRADTEALVSTARTQSGQFTETADRIGTQSRVSTFEIRETAASVAAQIRDQAAALLGGVRGREIPERFRAGGLEGWVQDRLVRAAGLQQAVVPLAKGGIVREPTLALVGEAGPEAVIPLTGPGAASALLPALPGPVPDPSIQRLVHTEVRTMEVLVGQLQARGGTVVDMVSRLESRADQWLSHMEDVEAGTARGVLQGRSSDIIDKIQMDARTQVSATHERVRSLTTIADRTETQAVQLTREMRDNVSAEVRAVTLQAQAVEQVASGASREFSSAAGELGAASRILPAAEALTDRAWTEADEIRMRLMTMSTEYLKGLRAEVAPIGQLTHMLEGRTGALVAEIRLGAAEQTGEVRTQTTGADLPIGGVLGEMIQAAQMAPVGAGVDTSAFGTLALPQIQAVAEQMTERVMEASAFMDRSQEIMPVPMAEGGIITKPTIALLGEAGPEAVVPLTEREDIMGAGDREGRHIRPRVTINQEITALGDRDLLAVVQQTALQAGAEGAALIMSNDPRMRTFIKAASRSR
jgi:tape measure domain-containing protein